MIHDDDDDDFSFTVIYFKFNTSLRCAADYMAVGMKWLARCSKTLANTHTNAAIQTKFKIMAPFLRPISFIHHFIVITYYHCMFHLSNFILAKYVAAASAAVDCSLSRNVSGN